MVRRKLHGCTGEAAATVPGPATRRQWSPARPVAPGSGMMRAPGQAGRERVTVRHPGEPRRRERHGRRRVSGRRCLTAGCRHSTTAFGNARLKGRAAAGER